MKPKWSACSKGSSRWAIWIRRLLLRTSSVRPSYSQRRRPLRWIAAALLIAIVVTYPFWLAGLGQFLVRSESPAQADMIVVLAGDFTGNRILTAGDLVRRGFAPRALISGTSGEYGLNESDLAIPFAVRHGYPESYFLALPNDSLSTRDEATDVIAALDKLHARRIDIVTSNYHTRRAGNIYRSKAPNLEFHFIAAPDKYFTPGGWWKNREGRKTFLMEWMKTAATWLGM